MHADRIALLLPEIYQRTATPGSPLRSLLEVMTAMHGPTEAALADFATIVDPQRTPDRFVGYLAGWVDLDRWLEPDSDRFASGSGRLRQLIATAAELSRRRGTAEGLRRTLVLALGVEPIAVDDEVVDAAGVQVPFHVRVTLPAGATEFDPLVRRIVTQEKPAHVTAEIVYADASSS